MTVFRARIARLFLAALAVSGCSIDRLVVDVDRPIEPGELRVFEEGITRYGEVLARLGPPAEIGPAPPGFFLRYASSSAAEWALAARYRGGKVAYSFGGGRTRELVLVFDEQGILAASTVIEDALDLGWGAIVGHTQSPELFFGAREYTEISPAHGWGRSLEDLGWGASLDDPPDPSAAKSGDG